MPTHQAYQRNVLSFLKGCGASNHSLDIIVRRTADFFVGSKCSGYGPLPVHERVSEDIMHAVSLATGKRVNKVEYFSFSDWPPKPKGMERHVYDCMLRNILSSALGDNLAYLLKNRHGQVVSGRLGSAKCQMLRDTLKKNYWMMNQSIHGALWDILMADDLWKHILRGVWPHLYGNIQKSFNSIIFYYHAYALLNDNASVQLLTPLFEEIKKSTPPFGFKQNASRTLLVPAK